MNTSRRYISKSPLETKPSNPKNLVGSNKIPFHLIPTTGLIHVALAMLDGSLKYGRNNFRVTGVRSSIYFDAAMRHLGAWFEGEDAAPDSGVDHLGHAIACILIVLDARAAGKLVDDRMYPGGYFAEMRRTASEVSRIKTKYAKLHEPIHYHLQSLLEDPPL